MPFVNFFGDAWKPEPCNTFDSDIIPCESREALLDDGSLTLRLKQAHQNTFFVQVIRHEWLEPTDSERAFLSCYNDRTSIREVLLFGSGRPVVYARSVLPASSLKEKSQELVKLGAHSLGEYLFNQPGLRRGSIDIMEIPAAQFNRNLDFNYHNEGAWARRSLFYLNDLPILVSEAFLPQNSNK